MLSATLANKDNSTTATASIAGLRDLAVQGLVQMLDPQSQLFCYKLRKSACGLEREGISHRYTMMTLLGLHRLEATGQPTHMDIQAILEALLRDTSWVTCAGDLGLLLWTCALVAPGRLTEVCGRLKVKGALNRYSDGRDVYTMELAWLLAGIAHCVLAGGDNESELVEQGMAVFHLLKLNCGATGICGHLAKGRTIRGFLRGRIGSFADQVYPIYAFSMFARACNNDEAKRMALQTARTICQLQGPQGEWSWHYDSSTGRIVSRYPVYSVHQHAMAPLALFAVGDATGENFSDYIYKGLSWISGNNELGMDFVEHSHGVIWRSIYLGRSDAYIDSALRALMVRNGSAPSGQLRIKYECRPYELGWLLYAFAGRGREGIRR
ncbi:MAG TPA: hypothetical protein VN948_20720 [Terriglobales bacterium]|nr:hypothetical protein [Terriglobales bacterium]